MPKHKHSSIPGPDDDLPPLAPPGPDHIDNSEVDQAYEQLKAIYNKHKSAWRARHRQQWFDATQRLRPTQNTKKAYAYWSAKKLRQVHAWPYWLACRTVLGWEQCKESILLQHAKTIWKVADWEHAELPDEWPIPKAQYFILVKWRRQVETGHISDDILDHLRSKQADKCLSVALQLQVGWLAVRDHARETGTALPPADDYNRITSEDDFTTITAGDRLAWWKEQSGWRASKRVDCGVRKERTFESHDLMQSGWKRQPRRCVACWFGWD